MSGFSINRAIQSGNLTSDPELRSLPSGTSLCKIRVAVNERYKDSVTNEWEDRANYFNWTIWGGIGEWVAKNLSKGDGVTLEGRAQWREWEVQGETRDDGRPLMRSAVEFIADSIVPQRSGEGGGGARTARQAEQAQAASGGFTPRSDVPNPEGDFTPAPTGGRTPVPDDDDIPF